MSTIIPTGTAIVIEPYTTVLILPGEKRPNNVIFEHGGVSLLTDNEEVISLAEVLEIWNEHNPYNTIGAAFT